jgi:cysteine desulfuration protein SufE
MNTIEDVIAETEADLALFPDWEERFGYLLDIGKVLPPLPEDARIEANKVRGCASQVWLVAEPDADDRLRFSADSDAHIVRGLIALLLRIFSGRTAAEIVSVEPKTLAARLGLADALTAQRANGLSAMLERIRRIAAARLESA